MVAEILSQNFAGIDKNLTCKLMKPKQTLWKILQKQTKD